MAKKKALHVSKGSKPGWGISGTTKAKGRSKTQSAAIKKATKIGKAEKRTVAIHGRDGKIKKVVRPYCGKPRNH